MKPKVKNEKLIFFESTIVDTSLIQQDIENLKNKKKYIERYYG